MNDAAAVANLNGHRRWHVHFYDVTRWAFLFGRTPLIRMAAERIRPLRILEVGCGTGKNLAELAPFPPKQKSQDWIYLCGWRGRFRHSKLSDSNFCEVRSAYCRLWRWFACVDAVSIYGA